MRVCLDSSVISRLTYTDKNPRFRSERQAAEVVVGLIRLGILEFIASDLLIAELMEGRPDLIELRLKAVPPYAECQALTGAIWLRANTLAGKSLGLADAVHTACAEASGASVLLTFDNRHVRGAHNCGTIHTSVQNALDWVREAYGG